MQQIIAIGGGGFADQPGDIVLEEYILAQTGSSRPKICYLPQAGNESREFIVRFYEAFIKLGRVPAHWSTQLLDQDVLYVGGGNTRSMLALWREWGVDRVLRDALEQGIVLAGVSAGAICWFKQGITDSSEQLGVLECLGFLEGSCCPHYDSEIERKPAYLDLIANDQAMAGLALTDGAASHFVDGQLKQIVTSRPEARGYQLTRQDNQAVEQELPATCLKRAVNS